MSYENRKLPYIPDKSLYAAVMGACKYVRETGYFNKAVSYYADRYGVDVEDVKKYVRMAQGKGQKQANAKKPPRKYKWWAVEFTTVIDEPDRPGWGDYDDISYYTTVKATSRENVNKHFKSELWYRGYIGDIWKSYIVTRAEPFDTESEAKAEAEKWENQQDKEAKA